MQKRGGHLPTVPPGPGGIDKMLLPQVSIPARLGPVLSSPPRPNIHQSSGGRMTSPVVTDKGTTTCQLQCPKKNAGKWGERRQDRQHSLGTHTQLGT